MEITRTAGDDFLEIGVEGRLDGYWADHLDSALTEAVREGHHRIRLDCARVTFLSSASLGVLVKTHKELASIDGSLVVVNPSPAVSTVLRITRLAALLQPSGPVAAPVRPGRAARRVEQNGLAFDVFELDRSASLACRSFGSVEPFSTRAYLESDCVSLEGLMPTLAIGIGAFGTSFEDCQARFGELISIGGATAYQPADGTNVPDYLIASGALGADVRFLHGVACTGSFSHLVRFETTESGGGTGLSRVLARCLEVTGLRSAGVIVIGEAAGLVGASLRRSPAQPLSDSDFFAHPGVRDRLTFAAERAFADSVALAAGVVECDRDDAHSRQLRPIGSECVGHLHAAAFRFRPIRKGFIDLAKTVAGLYDAEPLLGVLHLLADDRDPAGAGESEFVRGACWLGPIPGSWQAS